MRIKLLILVDRLDLAGGLERSLANKVRTWCDDGHEVHIASIEQKGRDYYSIDARAIRWNLDIDYARDVPLLETRNIKCAINHFIKLRRSYRKIRPTHIIHCAYGFDFYFLPIIARKAFLIKENHSSRHQWVNVNKDKFSLIKAKIRFWFDSRYDAAVFLSDEEARLSGLRNTVVIPNGLDERVVPDRERKMQVISAGRICQVKGFDRLIEAWAIASPKLAGWNLAIFGDGTAADVAELKNKIAHLGLSECVAVNPSTPEIIDRMAESRIYAMASRSECFPMVLLEAMQVGLPIVAYDCPTGPRNIITDGTTGVLVPDGDATAFSNALVKLANDPKMEGVIGTNARSALQRFESANIGRMWSALFSSTEAL